MNKVARIRHNTHYRACNWCMVWHVQLSSGILIHEQNQKSQANPLEKLLYKTLITALYLRLTETVPLCSGLIFFVLPPVKKL